MIAKDSYDNSITMYVVCTMNVHLYTKGKFTLGSKCRKLGTNISQMDLTFILKIGPKLDRRIFFLLRQDH